MRFLGKLQETANFTNDNKFILIANIFLITLVLKCLLPCQSCSLISVPCEMTLSYQSSLLAAMEYDVTFLVIQLCWAPFVPKAEKELSHQIFSCFNQGCVKVFRGRPWRNESFSIQQSMYCPHMRVSANLDHLLEMHLSYCRTPPSRPPCQPAVFGRDESTEHTLRMVSYVPPMRVRSAYIHHLVFCAGVWSSLLTYVVN